mgnify:CR=1 FL=1
MSKKRAKQLQQELQDIWRILGEHPVYGKERLGKVLQVMNKELNTKKVKT